MAKFLRAAKVLSELEDLLTSAKDRVILVSPYLQFGPRIQNWLADCGGRRLNVQIIYREWKLKHEENRVLANLPSDSLRVCSNLHAKCYMSENTAIVTSMNLYDYSQANNEEMGILVMKSEEPKLFGEIEEDVLRLWRISVPSSRELLVSSEPKGSPVGSTSQRTAMVLGHCIRCGERIPLDPNMPFCKSDYDKWAAYKNGDYDEKYCHRCGKSHSATMNKPACRDCFKRMT